LVVVSVVVVEVVSVVAGVVVSVAAGVVVSVVLGAVVSVWAKTGTGRRASDRVSNSFLVVLCIYISLKVRSA